MEDCPVCCTPFNNTARQPRSLPCGHTLCIHCINTLTGRGCLHCPTCRVRHAMPEEVIGKLKGAALVLSGTGHQQEAPEGLDWPVQSMLQLQKAELVAAIQACEEEEAWLDQYQSSLARWTEQQEHLQEKLEALLECSRNTSLLVQDVESMAAAKRDEIQQGRQQLQAQLEALNNSTSRREAYDAVEDAARVTKEAKLRTGECQAAFPDEETTSAISRVTEAVNEVVEAASTAQAALDIPTAAVAAAAENVALASSSSLMNTQQTLQPPPLTAQDLRSLTRSATQQLHAGRVYAVQCTQGQTRHGRIILQDGRLYLYGLVDQPPPPGTITMQVEEVVPIASPCLVFLDLAWPGTTPRRVLIRLTPDTPRGLQFLLLCTGQRGHTYVNTRLFDVWNKGGKGEFVCGGDYERNDGKGGAALVPDLEALEYGRPGKAGDVWWWGGKHSITKGAQFNIITRDLPRGYGYGSLFGKVEVGLEHVKEAVQHIYINLVTVVQCGVVV